MEKIIVDASRGIVINANGHLEFDPNHLIDGYILPGDLDLSNQDQLTFIPLLDPPSHVEISIPHLHVSGDINLSGCKNLKALPKNIIANSLSIENSGITELPEDLRLELYGNLVMKNTGIRKFPIKHNMFIWGALHMEGTGMTPNNIPRNVNIDKKVFF